MYNKNKHKYRVGGLAMGISQFLRYGVDEPDVYELRKPYYLLKKDGVYRHTSTGAMLIKEKYIEFGGRGVPGLPEGEEGVDYILPKIPFKYWLMILDFYKEVHEVWGTEASVHIYYMEEEKEIPSEYEKNKVGILRDGKWVIYCPQQVNTGVLTSFGKDKLYQWLIVNTIAVIETHSHHIMNAFWSGTDAINQQDTQFYGVYGRINTQDKFLMKYVIGGKETKVNVDEIFEFPLVEVTRKVIGLEGYNVCDEEEEVHTELYTGVFKRLNEYPKEWLTDCHSTRKPTSVDEEF